MTPISNMALTLNVDFCGPGQDFLLCDLAPRMIPRLPGIYIAWHEDSRTCLYIGRTCCLQDRVGTQRRHHMLQKLKSNIGIILTIFVAQVKDAPLALIEENLIRKHRPMFNAMRYGAGRS